MDLKVRGAARPRSAGDNWASPQRNSEGKTEGLRKKGYHIGLGEDSKKRTTKSQRKTRGKRTQRGPGEKRETKRTLLAPSNGYRLRKKRGSIRLSRRGRGKSWGFAHRGVHGPTTSRSPLPRSKKSILKKNTTIRGHGSNEGGGGGAQKGQGGMTDGKMGQRKKKKKKVDMNLKTSSKRNSERRCSPEGDGKEKGEEDC